MGELVGVADFDVGEATRTALKGELVGVVDFDVGVADLDDSFEEKGGGVDGTLNGEVVEVGVSSLGPFLDGD